MRIASTKFILFSVFALFSAGSALGQATWTGSALDGNWHNPENWSWEDGSSGIPDETTDVTLTEAMEIIVYPDSTAKVHSISVTADEYGVNMLVTENATLEVCGDILLSEGNELYIEAINMTTFDYELTSRIRFVGEGDQECQGVYLFMGILEVSKGSGDVVLSDNSAVYVLNNASLGSTPVPVGEAAHGNIRIEGGFLMMDKLASFVLPSFDGDQIPAHVIATEIPDLEEGSNFFGYFPILASMSDDIDDITGIQGTVAFPLGYDAYAYTPATVEQSGLNTNQWYARMDTSISSYECEEDGFDHSQSVQARWDIVPLILDMEDGDIYTTFEIENPATLSFSFNQSNVGKDVKEGFWVSNLDHLYMYNDEDYCAQYAIEDLISDTSANFITVTKEDQAHFNYFIIGGKEVSSGVDDVKVTYGIQLYPNPVSDVIQLKFENSHPEMNLTITDILGRSIYHEHIKANQLNQLHQIPVRDLLPGNYLIQCSGTGVSYNEKFVKQ